jgi:hypothetical protein
MAAMAGVDLDGGAHAGAQRRRVGRHLHGEPDRHALHHLHPVAGGVLRRQHRELGAGCGREAGDSRLPFAAGIGVDGDDRRRARLEVREIGLLRIGLDPHVGRGDQAEGGLCCRQVLADLQGINVGDDTRDRRQNSRTREVALGLVDLRLRREIARVLLDRRIGLAAELRQGGVGIVLRHDHALARRVEVALGLVVGRL